MDTKKMLQYKNAKKSTWVAYLLYFFLGGWIFQFHRFYAGSKFVALILLSLPIFSYLSINISYYNHSTLSRAIIMVWMIIGIFDIIYIPIMVKNRNNRILNQYFKD